jgi:hypothetical protein
MTVTIIILFVLALQRQIIKNPTPTLTLPLKVRGFLGFFPLSWAGSPIPPLSRGRLGGGGGGGWGKYVPVALGYLVKPHRQKIVDLL